MMTGVMRVSDSMLALGRARRPGCCRPANRWPYLGFPHRAGVLRGGVPHHIFLMHRRGIARDDSTALRLARRWAKVSVRAQP